MLTLMIPAAPRPCTARASVSAGSDGASAQASEASGEQREAGRVDAPVADRVAERRERQQRHGDGELKGVDDPDRARGWNARSWAIVGSATLTMVPSSTAMPTAMASVDEGEQAAAGWAGRRARAGRSRNVIDGHAGRDTRAVSVNRTRQRDPLDRQPSDLASRSRGSRRRRKSFTISRAALRPGRPLTPPPGWVDEPHM